MPDFQIDLNTCDNEPIHIPGQVQSHGFIIGLDDALFIRFHSDNLDAFILGYQVDLIGKPLSFLAKNIGVENPLGLEQLIILGRTNNFEQINPYRMTISGLALNLIISKSADYFMLEFEPAEISAGQDISGLIGSSISEMLGDKDLQTLLFNSAQQVKKIIGYDRVMVYRFAEDGHGEVVAEAKNEDLNSWLGLHYPASDIPKQARELYKLNLTRLIADVNTQPAKILGANANLGPIDLTHSQLRAVSPMHIQYLKNMGVASSFSISLIYKQELWGLIACHQYTPRFIPYKARSSAKLIGQILSSALEFRQDEADYQIQEDFNGRMEKLVKSLNEHEHIDDGLVNDQTDNLLRITQATGVVVAYEGRRTKVGKTPDDRLIDQLIDWLTIHQKEAIWHTDHLSQVFPESKKYTVTASGILVCMLSRELKEFIIWFKPEKLMTIQWAGNPEKPVAIDFSGFTHISPRHSFEAWAQTVSGKSEYWKPEELRSAVRLKEEILYAINQKAGAIRMLNERLRHAYEELDTFSYTISHDLKNPIAVIKNYVQLLKRSEIDERTASFLDRITRTADKMHVMIQEILEYSRIGKLEICYKQIPMAAIIREMVAEFQLIYGPEALINIGDTPTLQGDSFMIQQVFSNLIGNALKYSQESSPSQVHISGSATGDEICYVIHDNGLGIDTQDLPFVFDLFKRMQNTQHIEGSGVGLAIVKRIVDKHKGRIWVESEPGKGSKFFVCFNQ
ncbi:ATP-binding protein [Pedobacter sp. MC2016-24]|uniref:ATP-binding protein n=1 Tax=Pedobacter sp. MC2016-24 TaxID=2780090 RepID=UPI001880BBE6|nr:ATP-binding protein [Pedobacter sp. MC2016-24]MBE9599377.1 GAF domain-containing protein [Pedobacter sp. MC2016-24]